MKICIHFAITDDTLPQYTSGYLNFFFNIFISRIKKNPKKKYMLGKYKKDLLQNHKKKT